MTIHQDLVEAHALLTGIHGDITQVLDRLHDQRGGYPARTTGATATASSISFLDRPDPTSTDDVALTTVEAAALGRDTAVTELRILATDAQAIVRAARRIARVCDPHLEPIPARPTHGDVPDDWCTSCWRDDHHHTPIALRPDGSAYYAGLCRWCGGFRKEHDALPDLELLRIRHTRRVSTADVADWRKRRAAAKATKKKAKGKGA